MVDDVVDDDDHDVDDDAVDDDDDEYDDVVDEDDDLADDAGDDDEDNDGDVNGGDANAAVDCATKNRTCFCIFFGLVKRLSLGRQSLVIVYVKCFSYLYSKIIIFACVFQNSNRFPFQYKIYSIVLLLL